MSSYINSPTYFHHLLTHVLIDLFFCDRSERILYAVCFAFALTSFTTQTTNKEFRCNGLNRCCRNHNTALIGACGCSRRCASFTDSIIARKNMSFHQNAAPSLAWSVWRGIFSLCSPVPNSTHTSCSPMLMKVVMYLKINTMLFQWEVSGTSKCIRVYGAGTGLYAWFLAKIKVPQLGHYIFAMMF